MAQQDTTADEAQYAELDLDGSVVIYDTDNHRAWLQSDEAMACDAMV